MSDTQALLDVQDLTKHYEVVSGSFFKRKQSIVKAVEKVSFSLAPGETMALVGESGCGKTTTTKMLLRLEQPTGGVVRFEGKDVQSLDRLGLRHYRNSVQAVFQDPWSSLNPRMRVYDIIAEALYINQKHLTRDDIDKRIAKVMEDVGLRAEQARNFPHEFSGGQRQRVAVAAALVSDPKLIVLDEPVSALDVSVRAQIMNLFKDLQKEYGMSYVLVAHDLGTTRFMADKIAVMYLGKIVEIADTEEIFNNPSHPYTKALFSAALPAHPDEQTEEIILHGEVPSPLDPPSGCAFHPRCPEKIGKVCEEEAPELIEDPATLHRTACHLCTREAKDAGAAASVFHRQGEAEPPKPAVGSS
ncbi:peptide ABC transporter substrate-binding protein [Halomonas sp. 1513]|nr:oligopeptide/dipeptide ABC transporter ATP-binding protein [Halomonas sp. 1513]APX91503.1 peptide ABC transporter substrate-binding protein [Halomonas sp. 1513]